MTRPARQDDAAPPVRVDVLGPLRLTVGGTVVPVPGPKRRALLVLLAMAGGRAVPVTGLLDAVWPSGVPRTGRATLQSHVSRLRRHLAPAGALLEELDGAYRLGLGAAAVDARQARRLLDEATDLLPADPSSARAALDRARSLWRGPPLADLLDVAPIAAWCAALDGLRREIDEAFVAASIAAGEAPAVVGEAGALVDHEPWRESGLLLLMRALSASGRHVEALRAAYDFRRRLRTETGLDPSPALAELESEIAGAPGVAAPGMPRPATGLYGRGPELAAVHRLLARERLVTVTGPGGVGKTSLALEAARRTDRAVVLLLAPVTDPAAIPHALAAALDLRVVHGDVLAACVALLGAGPTLLVVDNCEHLLPSARDLVSRLLGACPDVTVLATSREPLGLAAETRCRLAPLPLPGAGHDPQRSPAVAVFSSRARRVRPDFAPTPDDLLVIGDIVRRLDGIPLAIELAAGRLSAIDLPGLRARLDRALDLLADGGTDARHGTLRQTIRWSYELLSGDERDLFRQLAVFPDGFSLMTAERLGQELGLSGPTTALARLVDASMVEVDLDGGPRYRLLDLLRRFALDEAAATASEATAIERFRRWGLDLVASADDASATAEEPAVDALVRTELGNLRALWRLVRERRRLDDAVSIVLALADIAGWRDLTEIWDWALELAGDPALDDHPRAAAVLGVAASSAWAGGDLAEAERLVRRGEALATDDEGRWSCLSAGALVALFEGQLHEAFSLARAAAALAPRPDQNLGVAALAAAYGGRLSDALDALAELEAAAVAPTLRGFHSYVVGEVESIAGHTDAAERAYGTAIELTRHSGATFLDGIASVGLMTVRAAAGRTPEALAGYRDLIDYWERTGGWVQQWTTLRNLARLLHDLDDHETALLLEGAADHAPDSPRAGSTSTPGGVAQARASRIRAEGASSSRQQVLAVARSAVDRHLTGAHSTPGH